MNKGITAGHTVSLLRQSLEAWAPILALSVAIIVLGIGGDVAREWARYERGAIEAGELWRLVTAHLVHLSPAHLLLNLAALVLIRLLVGETMTKADWIGSALASVLAIDAGLYLMSPEVEWYVGLSGVLHGLLATGALALLGRYPVIGGVLASGLAAKLLWEQLAGPMPFSASTAGGPVIVAAHLYGAAGGIAYTVGARAVRRPRAASL